MKDLKENINEFSLSLKKYLEKNDKSGWHYFEYLLKISNKFYELIGAGAVGTLVDIFINRYMPKKGSASHPLIEELREWYKTFITKLYLNCDRLSPETTLANDEPIKSLKILVKSFDNAVLGVERDPSLLIKPLRSNLINLLLDGKYFFQIILLMRKYNIEHPHVVNLMRLIDSIIDMPLVSSSAAPVRFSSTSYGLNTFCELMQKILVGPNELYCFQFYNADKIFFIDWKQPHDLLIGLQRVFEVLSIKKVPPELLSPYVDLFNKLRSKILKNQENEEKQVSDWKLRDKNILNVLKKLEDKLKAGIDLHCNPFFNSEANDKTKNIMNILLANMRHTRRMHETFNKMPFKSHPSSLSTSFIHNVMFEEANMLRDLLISCFDHVQTKKHPLIEVFRTTFAPEFKPVANESIDESVLQKIKTIFAQPFEKKDNLLALGPS